MSGFRELLCFKTVVLAVLCVGSAASPIRAVDYIKQPMDSAAFVYGSLLSVTSFLAECADYDKQNADSYNKLMLQYIQENSGLSDRLMTIMRTEAIRTGYPLETLNKMLFDARNMAAEAPQKLRREDPNHFLSMCQAQWEIRNRGLAPYSPLRERFPVQMRVIDAWK
jgi:hypothetical protein